MGILKLISSSKLHNPKKKENLSADINTADRFSFNVNKRLVVTDSEGYRIITFNSIRSLKSDSNYTTISLINGESILVCKTLKHFEAQLDHNFLRVHNSYMINLFNIKQYKKGESVIILDDDTSIPVARRKKSCIEVYFTES